MTGCGNEVSQKNKVASYEQKKHIEYQKNTSLTSAKQSEYIKFFYPDKELLYWLIDEKKMNSKELESILNELIKSEKNRIPKNTKLLSINVKDGTAFVDLSKDFEDFKLGDTALLVNVYSIVNLLCLNEQFNITGVKFLLDGNEVKIIGDTDTSDILTPNAKLSLVY
jgi:hypothetical protein